MKKLLAILLLGFSSVYAQTVTAVTTTPNLITSGTNHTWTGVTTGTLPSNYMPGGPTPIYDPSTNTISFSYNASAYVGQTIAINNALANVGAGVKINGYNYGYDVRNMNGDNRQGGTDTFTVSTALRGPNNSVLLSSSQYFNTKFEWTTYSGTKTATTPYNLSEVSYLQIGIQGGDNGYWGGYFGPQVRNVNMSLNYTVDPCATNPAFSPTCANYNTVSISNNLVPNPLGYAASGSFINQTYAINQALGLAGSNVMIHGFEWGYQANANGPYCGSWNLILLCLDPRNPSVTTNVNITDNTGASIYSISRTYTNSYNTTRYSYVFPSSKNLLSLGNFGFTATTNDQAYIGDMWSKALYTPDPCADPLSSPTCPGYAAAYQAQQCTISALYNSACPGYAVAYFNQQCTINQLYNQSCPGYAAAYLVQQCTINPLYSTTCDGYQTAYFNQQCSLDPLYNSGCTGYATAYHDQQCSLNPLYATDCIGYSQAYLAQQCSLNSLYSTSCPGYAQAYFNQQCSLNGLYDRTCPNYGEAYAKTNILTTTTTATTTPSTTATVAATTTESITSQLSSGISDATVSSVVTTKTTSTSSDTNPAAAVKLTSPAGATTTTVTAAATSEKKEEKKEEGTKSDASNNNSPSGSDNKSSDSPKTARQELAEKRREAAAKEAVAKGKDLANEMGKAADMEAQKAVQNVVIQAMGFTPGFDTYNKSMLPDSRFYKPYTVYGGQVNVDNKTIGRRLMGGSDKLHQDLVDSQYEKGVKND